MLDDFYRSLYCTRVVTNLSEIEDFLNSITSLPTVLGDIEALCALISVKEIENAIARLCPNKTPGCDGLTAEFYQHFQQEISAILRDVFNCVFEDTSLSDIQKIAIIILLFKKGDRCLLGNYRPISLTNADYKILAYILTGHLEEHLPLLISPQQTTYVKSCFIGMNICFIQDSMDYF